MIKNSFYKNRTVFITGHSGFKGCWLCEVLYLMGAKVVGYSKGIGEKELYSALKLDKKITSIDGDTTDLESLTKALKKYKPEIVIHMAAQPVVRYAIENPVNTYQINVMGTVNILEAIRQTNFVKSFLNVTTDKVYLNKETKKRFKETDVLCGLDPYSNSKSCSELVTYSFKNTYFVDREYPRVSTARAGNTIGGGRFQGKTLLIDCVEAIRKGEKISLRNPSSVRPYQHVLDTINIYLKILELQYKDRKYEGCYNVGPDNKDYVTNGKVVDLFYESWYENEDKNNWVKAYADIKESSYIYLDNSKVKKSLGFKEKYRIKDTIKEIAIWYKKYYNNEDMLEYTDQIINSYFEEK